MSISRATNMTLKDRHELCARLKEEVRRLEFIAKEKTSLLWTECLAPNIKASIEANQSALDNILDAQAENAATDFANCKALRGAIRAYKNVWDEMENTDRLIEVKRNRIAIIAEEIENIQRESQIPA